MKRALSIILAVILTVTSLPISLFAEDSYTLTPEQIAELVAGSETAPIISEDVPADSGYSEAIADDTMSDVSEVVEGDSTPSTPGDDADTAPDDGAEQDDTILPESPVEDTTIGETDYEDEITENIGNEVVFDEITTGTYSAPTYLTSSVANIASGTCGENLTWTLTDEGVLTISGTGAMTNYTIDSASAWSAYASQIKTVIVENGVTNIGAGAFKDCSTLESIVLPESIKSIGASSFYGCSKLESITIPNGVTYIGGRSFFGCSSLTEFTIPNGITEVYSSTFSGCSSLTNITIPNTVTVIGNNAFENCLNLVSISISQNITSIGSKAFNGCSNLATIRFESPVTSISDAEAIPSTTAIHGYEGSTAKRYANKYNRNFVSLGETPLNIRASGTCGNSLTWRLTYDNILTIDGSGDMFDYDYSNKTPWDDYKWGIESVVMDEGITGIGNYAFRECKNLVSVSIPNGLTSIGNEAFSGCESLTSIELPNSLTGIGYWSFDRCSSLSSVAIPNGVTELLGGTFSDCTNLAEVVIPVSVTTIWEAVFMNCSSLTSVTIPDGVTSIGNSAFRSCSNLTSVIIPASTTSIADDAFDYCTNLTNVSVSDDNPVYTDINGALYKRSELCGENLVGVLSEDGTLTISGTGDMYDFIYGETPWCSYNNTITSVVIDSDITSIGSYAFFGCSSLTSVTVGNGVTSIGGWAFSDCSNLTSINIPDSVTTIGEGAFACCDSLTEVSIPDSVTSIGEAAFIGCIGLKNVTIPSSVISMGLGTFDGCSNLLSVTFKSAATEIYDSAVTIPSATIIYGYDGSTAEAYAEKYSRMFVSLGAAPVTIVASGTCGDNLTWALIDDGTLTISGEGSMTDYTYYTTVPWYSSRSAIKSVVIGDGVTSICNNAFYDCSNLTSITIPDSVTSIGIHAFFNCTSLTGVSIPENMTIISEGTFSLCSSLTSITIPDSVTSIGSSAFHGCSSLTSITIPDGVISIGGGVFAFCTNLTSITIPDGVTSIGESAFEGCSSLTSINIPGSVISIGDCAFIGCSSLTSITVPDKVTSIGGGVFAFCTNLTSITIPDGVTSIGESAFEGCSSLTSIIIPDSATNIDECAFCNCPSLTSITFKSATTEVYDSGDTISDTATIYGYGGSTAQAYAKKYGREFVTLCDGNHAYGEWQKYDDDAHIHYCTGTDCNASETADHTWNSGVVTTEPTCATEGVKTFTCTDCGATYTESVPATGDHAYGEWQKYDGDMHIHYCTSTDCEASETADHVWNNGVVTTEPTCATEGVKTFTCSDCSATYTESVPATGEHIYGEWQKLNANKHVHYCETTACESLEVTDHNWDNGIITTEPTCATGGFKIFTCTDCGETYAESVPATGNHTYGNWQWLDEDKHARYCTRFDPDTMEVCSAAETVEHQWNGVITAEPTCATEGVKTFTCADCGATYTEDVSATGNHTYGNWQWLDDDKHIHYCTGAGCNAFEIAEHQWNGTITTEPTCATNGVKTFTCTDCSETYTESIPATSNHTYGDWQKLDGNAHVRYCTSDDCYAYETSNHSWNDGEVTTEPTCATNGVKTFTCTDCSATYAEAVPATGSHTYGNWQWLDDDKHIHYCTGAGCNAFEIAEHQWNGTITTEPTCATNGVKTFTCTDCSATYTESIPATGNHTYGNWQKLDGNAHVRYCTSDDCYAYETSNHSWNDGKVTTEPTCATNGVKTFTCTECDATYTEDVSATGNHTYGNWQWLDDDKHIHYCTGAGCEAFETAEHNWNNGVITTEPTCAIEGVKTFTCTDCSATYTESVPATGEHSYGAWTNYDTDNHIRYCVSDDCELYELEEHEWYNDSDVRCDDCNHIRLLPPNSPKLVVSDNVVYQGESVILTVAVKNCDLVDSIGLSFKYDASILTFDAKNSKWLNDDAIISSFDAENNTAALTTEHLFDANYVFAQLCFKVHEDAQLGDTVVEVEALLKNSSEKVANISTSANVTISETFDGDINGDTAIDKNDAIYLLYSVLFGEDTYPLNQTCDFNGDGSVDKNDAIYLLYHALFGAVSYPLN